jgi:hypothetical protein
VTLLAFVHFGLDLSRSRFETLSQQDSKVDKAALSPPRMHEKKGSRYPYYYY